MGDIKNKSYYARFSRVVNLVEGPPVTIDENGFSNMFRLVVEHVSQENSDRLPEVALKNTTFQDTRERALRLMCNLFRDSENEYRLKVVTWNSLRHLLERNWHVPWVV